MLLAAAATASAAPGRSVAAAPANARAATPAGRAAGVANAYEFLDRTMDLYATGSVPRLVQSFTGGVPGKHHYTASVTYDDALMVDALLAEGTAEGRTRAETIGEALLYVQANDPAHDGRVRAAYAPAPLLAPSDAQAVEPESDVGNMAWVGQALAHLYEATAQPSYLAGAVAIGEWIQANARDSRGAGGYTGGITSRGKRLTWKSTEHNIDIYGLFGLLAADTGNSEWTQRAAWARGLVEAMWEPSEGRFYEGTTTDGVTPEDSVRPEDVNSWSYLALRDAAFGASPDWNAANLAASNAGFSGVSFCSGDRSGVWFEGTAHMADALELRGRPGDEAAASTYLSEIERAQSSALDNDGLGIVASSKKKLSDCEGDHYYASLHTGATSWYVLAAQGVDPFMPLR